MAMVVVSSSRLGRNESDQIKSSLTSANCRNQAITLKTPGYCTLLRFTGAGKASSHTKLHPRHYGPMNGSV